MVEEKSKKEYQTYKIKRDGLEKVRDVFFIIRDILFILVLLGMLVALVLGIGLLANASQILNGIQSSGFDFLKE